MIRSTFILGSILLALGGPASIWAQKPSPLPASATKKFSPPALSGLQFRNVGPSRGGRVTAVAGVPQQPFTFYFGATGGGVWRSTDAGTTWKNLSDGGIRAGSIGAIAVAPSDPQVLYVGTGSADPRGNVSPGDGIYRSTNGGATWRHLGLAQAGQISQIVVHPTKPELVYVAVLGNVFGPNAERGVFRSSDGGTTWEKIHFVSDRTGAIEMVMDPSNPRILYAGMWTAERKPWTMVDGSAEGGVWKSLDGGNSWQKLGQGLPTGVVGRIGIALAPSRPNRVWVQIESPNEPQGGLYRSEDGGLSFSRINGDHNLRQRAWYYSRIYADPLDENTIYALNVNFLRSIDGGLTFSRISVPHGDTHVLWINPLQPNIMIQGNDGGACVSLNGGQTWSSQNNQPTAELYRVTTDNQFPYRLYGAQQDNSTISVPSKFDDALSPQEQWRNVGGGESGHIAVDPRNPNLIYAGNYIGQITRSDFNRAHRKDVVAYPQMHDGQAPRDIRYRFQWNAPIRISPHNPEIVYHCSQFVHRSADGGFNWEVISPDLTTNNDRFHDIPGGPVQHDHTGVELFTTIFAFEESPLVAGELWAGSDDGLLHLSRDHGRSWRNITPPGLPTHATINRIDLSAHAPGRALIAVHQYRENNFRPYIFLTSDYGQTWRLLTSGTNGIPANHFVRVAVEDPQRRGLIYAGTEFGLYFSIDEGANWHSLQNNLPITPITDLVVKEKDLVVATQGRSFWILDDLTPLHTLSAEQMQQPAVLYPPRPAYRTQLGNFRGGPDPAPNGAVVYFYLKNNVDSIAPTYLELYDAQGVLRRIWSSEPRGKEQKLPLQAGLNRLEWDLRFDPLELEPNSWFSLADTGPIKAPPGEYRLVLQHEGPALEQKLVVLPDPRWRQTAADLQAQYALSSQVKKLLEQCHALIGDLRAVHRQVDHVVAQARQYKPEVLAQIEEPGKKLQGNLRALEEKLIQTRNRSSQDPINYPSQLDDQMAYLYSIVEGQDDRPTQGCYQRLADLQAAFQPFQEQFQRLKAQEIAAFNRLLVEHGLQLILTH